MYIRVASPSCLRFDWQVACRAFSRACAKTGKRIAARIAIMAITTRSSMRGKARSNLNLDLTPFRQTGLRVRVRLTRDTLAVLTLYIRNLPDGRPAGGRRPCEGPTS